MTTALATTLPNESEFDVMVRTAKSLVQSGFLPSAVKTPQQAVAILMMSRELGIGAWAGLNGINVIAGKPTISPQLMLALINRSGELENIKIEGDDKSCTVTMTRRGREPHSETFTMKEAERMMTQEWVNGEKKTIPLSQKYNWRQMPATMLKWRAVSACARVVFPDVIIGFYTPEEIDPSVTVDMETGEIVERPAPAGNGKPAPEPPAIEEGEVVEPEQKPAPQKTEDKPAPERKLARPYDAETFRKGYLMRVGKSDVTFASPTDKQAQYLASLMTSAFKESSTPDADRLAVLGWLTGRDIASTKDLTGAEAKELLDILAADGGDIDKDAYQEMQNCLAAAYKANGQGELFPDAA